MKPYQILALLLLVFFTPNTTYAQKAKHHMKAAEEFIATGKYNDALTQYSKALDIEPDNVEAYIARGQIYEHKANLDSAKSDYERALTFESKNVELYYLAANAEYKSESYDKALAYINQALDRDKKFLRAVQLQVNVYIKLERYNDALIIADKALKLRYDSYNLYMRGVIYELLKDNEAAEQDFDAAIKKNKGFIEAYVAMAKLSLKMHKLDQALANVNSAIEINQKYTEAYLVRSQINIENLRYAEAINDISKNIIIDSKNALWYFTRGIYYLDYAQYQNAINDFSKAIELDNTNANAYYKRAFAYEQIRNLKNAIADYKKLTELSEYNVDAQKLLVQAEERMFELNRESTPPIIRILSPEPININELNVPKGVEDLKITGVITDESELKEFLVNGNPVQTLKTDKGFEFITEVEIEDLDKLAVVATDVYNNLKQVDLTIKRTEIDPPTVKLLAPFASDNGEIYLDTDAANLYIEGIIEDESTISSIMVSGVSASYRLDEANPKFTANIDIFNKSSFEVTATDMYGNTNTQTFTFNREAISISQNNPMGKTWVVFIENSNYTSLASLEGPGKDVSLMRSALANYKVHNIIHKKDMTKEEMEKFFSIELRDLVKSNQVNSLVVWYAGHGKFVNETGYWIPVNAARDDEFTYFNISSLKSSLQAYSREITHTLVITDACESGPTFYSAMRSELEDRSCNDWKATKLRSSQVFSSAGYELAVDNSQFTKTFASTLKNSGDACVPIEDIVITVTRAVAGNNQQKPKFGLIDGLEDEGGTFFFIAKD